MDHRPQNKQTKNKKTWPQHWPQNKAKKSGKIKEATEEKMKKLGCPPAQ